MVELDAKAPGLQAEARRVVQRLRDALRRGAPWCLALLEAMALWPLAQETYRGRRYNYLILGEAFDWLLLAERLCAAVGDLIPRQDRERLLFDGRWPPLVEEGQFREILGVAKYRAYLNYYYGVTVEEAVQLAVEQEVHKRHLSNGRRYVDDFSDEAYRQIYGAPREDLLARFLADMGYPRRSSMGLDRAREFTYWLFKYRLKVSDRAKMASDTRKGLDFLARLVELRGLPAGPLR